MRYIQRQFDDLKQKETLAKDLIDHIKPFFKSKFFSIPKLQFFDGKTNVDAMLYDFTDAWWESQASADNIWWGYQDPSFVSEYREWLEFSWERKSPQAKIQLISNRSTAEKQLKGKISGRIIKEIPDRYDFSSTIWVIGEYIVMLMTKNEPHYAFQIKDQVFSRNLRLVFELMWDVVDNLK